MTDNNIHGFFTLLKFIRSDVYSSIADKIYRISRDYNSAFAGD